MTKLYAEPEPFVCLNCGAEIDHHEIGPHESTLWWFHVRTGSGECGE